MTLPFFKLEISRKVLRSDLPNDLARFYEWHEGVGLDCDADRPLRVCRVNEVNRIGWKGLLMCAVLDCAPEGWEDFQGLLIGMGPCFEEIVYVLHSPSCSPGSIMALGGVAPGPGGNGPFALEPSLVLGHTLDAWLAHLESWNRIEYILDSINELPLMQQRELIKYFVELNPQMNHGY